MAEVVGGRTKEATASDGASGRGTEKGRKRGSEDVERKETMEETRGAKVVAEKGFETSENSESETTSKMKTGRFTTQFTKKKASGTEMKPKLGAVAKAFRDSESEEEEEMPPEAKQRMRNIGKHTPTSSGPRSFNKSKGGFSNSLGEWSTSQKLSLGQNKPDTDS